MGSHFIVFTSPRRVQDRIDHVLRGEFRDPARFPFPAGKVAAAFFKGERIIEEDGLTVIANRGL
jgi:hypothetical protein